MRSKSPRVERDAPNPPGAFTILEILVAVTLLALILVLTGSIISSSSRAWRQANASIETFQSARAAFDVLTARLSRATLNTYWDYYDAANSAFRLAANPAAFVPARYGRYSDLDFRCGPAADLLTSLPAGLARTSTQAVFFVAPTGYATNPAHQGVAGLLGASGYFVVFGNDDASRPGFLEIPSRWRWRLMEVTAPVEQLQVYANATGSTWFTDPVSQGEVRTVAENVIALIVWPRRAPQDDPDGNQLSPDYAYNSRTTQAWSGTPPRQPVQAHQLPPILQITLVAIDESAARRMENGSQPPAAITNALDGLFDGSVAKYGDDLQTLESRLSEQRINHRVFSTTVTLRESKWSP